MVVTDLTAPAVEPLTLAEAKDFLRVTGTQQDALISALISAARAAIEAHTRTRLITQTVRLTAHDFCRWLSLPVWPIQSVDTMRYTASDGTDTLLDPATYQVVEGQPKALMAAYGLQWPTTRDEANAVRIDLTLGYGDSAADVPEDIINALRFLVASYHEHRLAAPGDMSMSMPAPVRDILAPRVFWF